MNSCPCNKNNKYAECCAPFLSGEQSAPTPEALMRSRYTAYTQANIDYIIQTMKSPAADNFDVQAAKEWAQTATWTGLVVLDTKTNNTIGTVEFIATYFLNNQKQIIHEISKFVFEEGKWYYISGTHPQNNATTKIGRNDNCPCGSNKKYKKCCGTS